MKNAKIAEIFETIAGLLEMKGEKIFTVRAYQRAARTIERLPVELDQLVAANADLREIPGIGKAISEKIVEMVGTSQLRYYDSLRAEFPEGILELMHVPGLGPKLTMRAWKELGVTNLDQLESSIHEGTLESLPRMGKKAAENILRHLRFARSEASRIPIARAMPVTETLIADLRAKCASIKTLLAGGSLRRFEETVGDIDLICTSTEPNEVLNALVDMPAVVEVLGHGDTKASVILEDGIQVDLRVVDESHLGALLVYFTGNKQHNIQLRDHANKLGLSINEYGITEIETGEVEEYGDEESLYRRLGLQFIPVELRQGVWEIDAAREARLPDLVTEKDLRGDLHLHTDWSDGRDPLELMVAAARDRGLEYFAITDHSVGRGIANGLSPERIRSQNAELRRIADTMDGPRVLLGTEMDIRADGSLDFPDEVLADLDWVVASVHSAMDQDSVTITERIIKAMRNPHVSAIGHPSTRRIGERQPIDADFEALFRAAADTGTAMEINSNPERMDLKDTHVYRARELGVPLVIDTDAHTVEAMENVRYGVAIARRGWCAPRHIINTMPSAEFMAYLGLPKQDRVWALSENAQPGSH